MTTPALPPTLRRSWFPNLVGAAALLAGGLGSLFSLFALLMAMGKPYANSATDPLGIFVIFILPPGIFALRFSLAMGTGRLFSGLRRSPMKIRRIHVLVIVLGLALGMIPFREKIRMPIAAVVRILKGQKTVSNRVAQYGPGVRKRLAADFERVGVAWPPEKLTLVGLKQERMLEVWVSDPPRLLKSYPILGASGTLWPKLKQGDRQVPEGIYRIESLNPNSLYHLALRVNYPNPYDQAKEKLDGRDDLGGDIMIHGTTGSVGCLAMGNEAAEDLFVLAAETGIDKISLILSPVDFRVRKLPENLSQAPAWTSELYSAIQRELVKLKPAAE